MTKNTENLIAQINTTIAEYRDLISSLEICLSALGKQAVKEAVTTQSEPTEASADKILWDLSKNLSRFRTIELAKLYEEKRKISSSSAKAFTGAWLRKNKKAFTRNGFIYQVRA